MENHNTHLAPGFTLNDLDPAPANVAIFWGLLGPGGFNSLYQMSFQQWNRFCGQREDGDWGEGVGAYGKSTPSPKAAGEKVENWK